MTTASIKGRDRLPQSAEHELLVHCARTRLEPARMQRIQEILDQQTDWAELLRGAVYHRIAPFLLRHLVSIASDSVPKSVLISLREACIRAVGQSLQDTAELCRVLSLLEARGISAIPLKGPVLAIYAYGDLSLRRFGDLDILVRETDVQRARRILLAQGYRSMHRLAPVQDWILDRFSHHYSLVPEASNGISVELHWKPSAHVRLSSFEELWDRAESISLGGRHVRTLSGEDLILFLCVHGSQHSWLLLEWIVSVAEVIHRYPLDWSHVIARAEEFRITRRVRLGLLLAHDLLAAPLPAGVTGWIQEDPRAGALAGWVEERLFKKEPDALHLLTLPRFRFQLAVRERFRDRVRFCYRVAAKPNQLDLSGIELPASMFHLYSIRRLFRLAGKQLRKLASG